jgi:protein gp37
VLLGVSVGLPESISRIAHLQSVPAFLRFIEFQPLLARIALTEEQLSGIGWAIIGGESGMNARPMNPRWATYLVSDLNKAGVPIYFKQWGAWTDGVSSGVSYAACRTAVAHRFHNEQVTVYRVGMNKAGSCFHGRILKNIPERVVAGEQNQAKMHRKW